MINALRNYLRAAPTPPPSPKRNAPASTPSAAQPADPSGSTPPVWRLIRLDTPPPPQKPRLDPRRRPTDPRRYRAPLNGAQTPPLPEEIEREQRRKATHHQLALFIAKHPQPTRGAPKKPPPTKLSLLRKRSAVPRAMFVNNSRNFVAPKLCTSTARRRRRCTAHTYAFAQLKKKERKKERKKDEEDEEEEDYTRSLMYIALRRVDKLTRALTCGVPFSRTVKLSLNRTSNNTHSLCSDQFLAPRRKNIRRNGFLARECSKITKSASLPSGRIRTRIRPIQTHHGRTRQLLTVRVVAEATASIFHEQTEPSHVKTPTRAAYRKPALPSDGSRTSRERRRKL
ncbi:unnamed protein product [Trichogramma brassicae]|uniref:Uncharacterized protein n=1 Tax=Trichogramma brassicae TaxID=86971 RepID=A0A6H5I3X2_9HYME|nr:unnamed protein product [Trichogramma brassicae]